MIDLKDVVNRSGFPLQIAVENLVRSNEGLGWAVIYSEHAWANSRTKETGFSDLVLRKENAFLIVECKRPQEGPWIFFRADEKKPIRRHAKCWISCYRDGSMKFFDWHDVALEPASFQAAFCVTPRIDSANPMLERVASGLVEATEGLAIELKDIKLKEDPQRFFFNVIVTTADLYRCDFDPAKISLRDGKISDADCKPVPFVRFRKQLATHHARRAKDLRGLVSVKESTVFVVNASALQAFLKHFEIDGESLTKFS